MINDNLTASERLKYFKFSSYWELLSPDNGGVGGGGVPVGGIEIVRISIASLPNYHLSHSFFAKVIILRFCTKKSFNLLNL